MQKIAAKELPHEEFCALTARGLPRAVERLVRSRQALGIVRSGATEPHAAAVVFSVPCAPTARVSRRPSRPVESDMEPQIPTTIRPREGYLT